MAYQLPVAKIKLTNVAVVKLVKNGTRFEVACYRNKVLNYRQGIETDLSEVLQTERVFVNAQKGEFASQKLLQQVFGTTDERAIAQLILKTGHVQISELERTQQSTAMHRMIATYLAEHCIHPTTGASYTVSQISHAMKDYPVHPTRSLKQQSMDCLKKLQQTNKLTICRAKMELQFIFLPQDAPLIKDKLSELHIVPTQATLTTMNILIDPSLYRPCEQLMTQFHQGQCQILRQVVKEVGELSPGVEDATLDMQHLAMTSTDASTGASNSTSIHHTNHLADKDCTDDHDNDDDDHVRPTHRAEQKKQQKQSKKAKRREKEEAIERQELIEAEQSRRIERQGVSISTDLNTTTTTTNNNDSTKACNTCGGSFSTSQYRTHFKSDWHRYNQKLLLKGMTAISEAEFLLCDADLM